jgi:hypothetical protein
MATIVVGAGNKVKPHRKCRIAYFPEAASQSFDAGDVVILSSGKVAIAGSDPAANTIVGVAAQDATGVTDTKIGVYLPTEDAEFSANVQDTGALAITNVGAQYGLVLDSTNAIFRVDLSDTTNKRVTVTELLDAAGDVNGRVVFKFMNAARLPHWS